MGIDLKPEYALSHTNTPLADHTKRITSGTLSKTLSNVFKLSAIFHDLGKLNPYFQEKLSGNEPNGYSGHAYLSAYSWFSFLQNPSNQEIALSMLGNKKLYQRTLAVAAIIAHHHGNLPNLYSEGVFKERGYTAMQSIFDKNFDIWISDYLKLIFDHYPFEIKTNSNFRQSFFKQSLIPDRVFEPLDFFLETQFSFASLIKADKIDASKYQENRNTSKFFGKYNYNLNNYIRKFKLDSELNKLRTKMRVESVNALSKSIKESDKRVFSLTAPTGSGKTIMLLSLAGEILKQKGQYRIIYSIPFLSIADQIESECVKIFGRKSIKRIDSRTEDKTLTELIRDSDNNPKLIQKLISFRFSEKLFDYPFIITTFVQFFETLVSNRNAKLLKLPNYSKAIFLIDEIQSLPPRLYGFFVALIDQFCKKFDSYAIISTATMPNFVLPEEKNNTISPNEFFSNYSKPKELLTQAHYKNDIFNRYEITRKNNTVEISGIADELKSKKQPVLIILNTIQDTKDLYNLISQDKKSILLNTHFIPKDRNKKIDSAKNLLKRWSMGNADPFLLITTQLIEAGVDIDFPVVYRDIAPIPNIIQSAGRCNRNGQLPVGEVNVFELTKNDQLRARYVYGRDSYKEFLNFPIENLTGSQKENELLQLQKKFFTKVKNETLFGVHKFSKNKSINFIKEMSRGNFAKLGKFQLINKKDYGQAHDFYVPTNQDVNFKKLKKLNSEMQGVDYKDFKKRSVLKVKIDKLLKKMASRIVSVNIRIQDNPPLQIDRCRGIELISKQSYSYELGIKLDTVNQII